MAQAVVSPASGRSHGLLAHLAVFVGSALALNGWIFSTGAVAWARTLENPSWSPPGPVIGTVWVVLFALMAVAAHGVATSSSRIFWKRAAWGLIVAEYIVCMTWTWAYFGLENVANGFYVTVAAWVLGLAVLAVTWRASPRSSVYLVPLQGWLTFALALSWTTWRMNV